MVGRVRCGEEEEQKWEDIEQGGGGPGERGVRLRRQRGMCIRERSNMEETRPRRQWTRGERRTFHGEKRQRDAIEQDLAESRPTRPATRGERRTLHGQKRQRVAVRMCSRTCRSQN